MTFLIYLYYLIVEGVDISMRKDITIEKLLLEGDKVNKFELARLNNYCWRTIDRRFNPDKYKIERNIEFILQN